MCMCVLAYECPTKPEEGLGAHGARVTCGPGSLSSEVLRVLRHLPSSSVGCLKFTHVHNTQNIGHNMRVLLASEKWPCLERSWWVASMEM